MNIIVYKSGGKQQNYLITLDIDSSPDNCNLQRDGILMGKSM